MRRRKEMADPGAPLSRSAAVRASDPEGRGGEGRGRTRGTPASRLRARLCGAAASVCGGSGSTQHSLSHNIIQRESSRPHGTGSRTPPGAYAVDQLCLKQTCWIQTGQSELRFGKPAFPVTYRVILERPHAAE